MVSHIKELPPKTELEIEKDTKNLEELSGKQTRIRQYKAQQRKGNRNIFLPEHDASHNMRND